MASERKGRIFSDTEEDSTLWRQQLSNLTEGIVFLNNEFFKSECDSQRVTRCLFQPECDISVSKLLGFETFPFFYGIGKSIGIGFEKKLYSSFWFLASLFLFWTPSFEHDWKAMSLGIITMTSPQILI